MSNLMFKEMLCPYCEHPNEAEVWSSINVKDDPELKDVLLGGELNMTECQACRKIFYAEHFLLYHDPARELIAFVYERGQEDQRAKFEEKTQADFELTRATVPDELQINYPPTTLFGLDALLALVEWDEEVQIQSEIVSVLSQQKGFPIQTLRPANARRQKLPDVLPWSHGTAAPRDLLINGIDALLKLNDRLNVYAQARQRLINEPDFQPTLEARV
jgi:hypothetical protein